MDLRYPAERLTVDDFRLIDGRLIIWDASLAADPNPMPRLRLFRWLRPSSNGGPN